jgi:MFS transporter, PPP family, 3-phenylpropionic acid transporter
MGGMGLLVSFGAYVNVQLNSYLFEARGLSPSQIGAVGALGNLAALFSPVLAGWWTDRSGSPRLVLAVYLVVGGLALAGMPHLQGLGLIAVGFFAAQIALSPISPLSQSLVIRKTEASDSVFFAMRSMGTLGFFLVSIWLSRTLRLDGLNGAYFRMGLLLVGSLPFFLSIPGRHSIGPGLAGLRLSEVVASLWDRQLWAVYIGGGLGFFCNAMGGTILANLITGPLRRGPQDISRAWAVATGFEMVFMMLAIPYVRRFGLKSLLVTGFVATSVRWIGSGLAVDYSWLLVAQTLHGMMVVGIFTGQSLILARLSPPQRLSSGMAAAALLNGGVMSVAGAMLAGCIWQRWGVRAVCFTTAAVALAAALFYVVKGPAPDRSESTRNT